MALRASSAMKGHTVFILEERALARVSKDGVPSLILRDAASRLLKDEGIRSD